MPMLHKMLIFKRGNGFSSSRRRNQCQPDAKVEQGIPLSNPAPTLFHSPPSLVEKPVCLTHVNVHCLWPPQATYEILYFTKNVDLFILMQIVKSKFNYIT